MCHPQERGVKHNQIPYSHYTMKKRSLKYGLFYAIGLLAVIMFASALCFWIIPAVNGKWEAMPIALWMYGWYYGYYLFTKRYTKWWKEIGE